MKGDGIEVASKEGRGHAGCRTVSTASGRGFSMDGEARGAFGGSEACGRLGEARTGGELALQFLLTPGRIARGAA